MLNSNTPNPNQSGSNVLDLSIHDLSVHDLSASDFSVPKIRAQIIQKMSLSSHIEPIENSNSRVACLFETSSNISLSETWMLLGTQGCHLCEQAETTLKIFSQVHPVDIIKIDITDLDETLMLQFAHHIPIVLSPSNYVSGHFSVVDLQKLI